MAWSRSWGARIFSSTSRLPALAGELGQSHFGFALGHARPRLFEGGADLVRLDLREEGAGAHGVTLLDEHAQEATTPLRPHPDFRARVGHDPPLGGNVTQGLGRHGWRRRSFPL